jgi:hypothetical protein
LKFSKNISIVLLLVLAFFFSAATASEIPIQSSGMNYIFWQAGHAVSICATPKDSMPTCNTLTMPKNIGKVKNIIPGRFIEHTQASWLTIANDKVNVCAMDLDETAILCRRVKILLPENILKISYATESMTTLARLALVPNNSFCSEDEEQDLKAKQALATSFSNALTRTRRQLQKVITKNFSVLPFKQTLKPIDTVLDGCGCGGGGGGGDGGGGDGSGGDGTPGGE